MYYIVCNQTATFDSNVPIKHKIKSAANVFKSH